MAESEVSVKSSLMMVKNKSEKPDLKLNIKKKKKPKILPPRPITSLQIEG